MLLEVNNVNVFIRGAQVLHNVSLVVDKGECVYIIGRNGAGKTTLLKSILGLLDINSGNIKFNGTEIQKIPAYKRVLMGIGYSPDYRGIFPLLTVQENIEIATRFLSKEKKEEVKNRIFKIFPELEHLMERKGLYLSGGEGKMLSIGRALALDPALVLLDEPLEGLSPLTAKRLYEGIEKIKGMGLAMLIAESKISNVPEFVDRIYVIERGEIIFKGGYKEFVENEEVLKIVRGV
jgi:branched-chain amino acid transport system ATP-binding protein